MYNLMYFNIFVQLHNNWYSSFKIPPSTQNVPKLKGSQHSFPWVAKPTFDPSVSYSFRLQGCTFSGNVRHMESCTMEAFPLASC